MRLWPRARGGLACWLSATFSLCAAHGCGNGPSAPPAPIVDDIVQDCVLAEPDVSAGLARSGLLENADYYKCEWPTGEGGAFFHDLALDEAVLTGIPVPVEALIDGADSLSGRTILLSASNSGFYALPIDEDWDALRGELFWNEELASGNRSLRFAILSEGSDLVRPTIGETLSRSVYVIKVGTGDVQINLHWGKQLDLDLYVTDPSGFQMNFAAQNSPTGGSLDLDSYANCYTANDRGRGNENVFWPDGTAPRGTYRVEVDAYSFCGMRNEPVPYRVTVVQDRTRVETFRGMFDPLTHTGEHHVITTFTR